MPSGSASRLQGLAYAFIDEHKGQLLGQRTDREFW